MKINPLTRERIRKFKALKRGYYSLVLLLILVIASVFSECIANSRALLVYFNGNFYMPTYGEMIPGKTFGFSYDYETNYRELKKKINDENLDGFVVMPPIPYNPYENDFKEGKYPPFPPSFAERHFLGTDKTGRDIAARLLYGFRIALFFSIALMILTYSVGITVGSTMGYFGGRFDLYFQRIIEIWSNIPSLYVIIIISSIVIPNAIMLLFVMFFFDWTKMTWYMRTAVYKEREKEYVLAAKAVGASNRRVIFKHILPNTVSIIITFVPFSVAGGIASLTALDYLGFGLRPPTPSWGHILSEGYEHFSTAPWIGTSAIVALVVVLTMVTFIGEAVRESFDPKMFTTYE